MEGLWDLSLSVLAGDNVAPEGIPKHDGVSLGSTVRVRPGYMHGVNNGAPGTGKGAQ